MKVRTITFLLLLAAALPASAGTASETPILPPGLPWDGESRRLALSADDPWATPFERSGLTRSPSYDETRSWLRKLVDSVPELAMLSLGKSAEGRDIWMIVASREGLAHPQGLRKNGRPTLLVHAGIHSGEIDGKDAGMMLLRDMTVLDKRRALLDRANLLFIPILSVDAHERSSPFGRINQRGPAETGWRTNRRNLNLNRDYAKLETEELQALVATILRFEPDLYIDVHVTDGADYQYDVTYGYNGRHAWSPRIAEWLDERFTPSVNRALERMGHVPGPLTFGANRRDMDGGAFEWTADVRFSNGWGDARHLPTILVENHSLKPYDRRVLGTYVFLEAAIEALGDGFGALREARAADRRSDEEVALGWQVGTDRPTRRFKGVRSELYLSSITGEPNVRWTGEPREWDIAIVANNVPKRTVRRPASYFFPAAWYPIAEKLRAHGIAVERLDSAELEVETLRLPEAKLDAETSPFEGRMLFLCGEPVASRRVVRYPAGSFRVDTDQPLGTLAVLLLEPQADDSLFRWGYFASILQRTEYVERYVMEPMALAMLAEDPELRAAFEARLLADPAFADDAGERLQWFYRQTPFFDSEYRLYPVARSLD